MQTTYAKIAELCGELNQHPVADRGVLFLMSHLLDTIRDHTQWPHGAFAVQKNDKGVWFTALGPGGKCDLMLSVTNLQLETTFHVLPENRAGMWNVSLFGVEIPVLEFNEASEAEFAERAAQAIKQAFVNALRGRPR